MNTINKDLQPDKGRKRRRTEDDLSPAGRYNRKLLRALQKTMEAKPDADMAKLLPRNYSEQLLSFKADESSRLAEMSSDKAMPSDDDIRSKLSTAHECTTLFELSTDVQALLSRHDNLPVALMALLARSKVIYKSAWAASVTVFRVSETVAVKITNRRSTLTETRTLDYLQTHLLDFPAPKLQGLIKLGPFYLMFTTFLGTHNLEDIWPQMEEVQKRNISTQLDKIFYKLRSLPFTTNDSLGETGGGGCKDVRRGFRTIDQPVKDVKQFEDFVFAGATRASSSYIRFLRSFKPTSPMPCVFTHGDLHPGNILVGQEKDGSWKIAAIIDWENSGFYPAYWESIKMTNTMDTSVDSDWHLFLPESCSPSRYPVDWLVDAVLDRSLANS